MFKKFSTADLSLIALILDEEDENERLNSKRRRRIWIHPMLEHRKIESEFFTLHKELMDDETKFYQYYRLSKDQFNYVLNKIRRDITKNNTTFREAITPIEKLAVCLRYVIVKIFYN